MYRLFLFLFILSPFLTSECNSQPLAPALYAFGDSLSDHGNSNFAKFKPYGINFPTGIATGRVTDGKTFVDFIAENLGLPFPQAYLNRQQPRSKTGFSYANAGCGILPHTGGTKMCGKKNIDGQINWFKTTIDDELAPYFGSPTELAQHLANSIILVWGGSNDYLLNYFMGNTVGYNSEEFADLLIDSLSHKFKNLHEMGARKFVVLELGPLGCIPLYRMNEDHEDTWCDESKNKNATMFNTRLAVMVQKLANTYSDSYFTLGQLYSLTDKLFKNPADYGMTNVSSACCKTGIRNLACLHFLKPCEKPHEYLFFDGAHPTQAAYNILASKCFDGTGVCGPMNIKELAQVQITSPSLHSAA